MQIKMPYFMTNEDWYYFDKVEFCYKLTDKATPKAAKSYEEYYSLLEKRNNE